jgi:hypothetical protein
VDRYTLGTNALGRGKGKHRGVSIRMRKDNISASFVASRLCRSV